MGVESRGMWRSVSRPCAIDDEGCVMSHSFPRYYGAQEHCRLEIEEALAGPLRVTDFNTERRHDFLTINGKAYSGTEGPQGVVPHGDIEWRSDHSISKRGWRLCPPLPAQAAEPAKAAPEAGEDGDGRPAFLVYAPVLPLAAICLACYCGPTCRRALRRWGSASARQNEFDQDPGCGDVADLCGEEVVVFEEASHEHRELLRRDVPGPSGEPDADAGEADAGETSEAATCGGDFDFAWDGVRKKLHPFGQVDMGHKTTKLSQRQLESAILRRCAAGRDRLDRRTADGVKILKVKPGEAGFPGWRRKEGPGPAKARGGAEWYIPPNADPRRRMLFLHGGSYVVYAPKDAVYRSLASRIAKRCGLCVLSLDYRLAPEHLFPAALEDASDALQWLAMNGPPGQGSGDCDLFVCGDSAGGGLALSACMAQAAAVRAKLRGVIGLSAWTDLTASTPSYDSRQWSAEKCSGDAVNAGVDRQSGREEAEAYLGRGGVQKHGKDWRASPFFAPFERLRKLPPVLLQVGDFELILDESVFGSALLNLA
ncbi:unnamed protein product [Effrenium voratum]|uniref:Alpha/beta hydrolase fold-3 domain-containing protein n=1 Tax=Effrenium voratum TaxID=2562239 RepID=A0AA36JK34_9DINO|nr:unnamed protein product [Effrenium voratum]